MKKILFVLPLSFTFASETMIDKQKADEYTELLSEFSVNLDAFRTKFDSVFQARFDEAWAKKYPDIILEDYHSYCGQWDVFLPDRGISKTSGEVYEGRDLIEMVMEVWNSVTPPKDSRLREMLPALQYFVQNLAHRCEGKSHYTEN